MNNAVVNHRKQVIARLDKITSALVENTMEGLKLSEKLVEEVGQEPDSFIIHEVGEGLFMEFKGLSVHPYAKRGDFKVGDETVDLHTAARMIRNHLRHK